LEKAEQNNWHPVMLAINYSKTYNMNFMRRLYLFLLASMIVTGAWSQAAVQVIHNSPTPGTDSGPTVDIYVNGALTPQLTALEYREATSFITVPSGADIEVAVAVSPSSSVDDAIATFPLGALDQGVNYTVVATGIVGDMTTPFNLAVNAGAQTTGQSALSVDLNIFHGSTDAPNVDVNTRFNGPLIGNLAYGNFTSSYLGVPVGTYVLDISAAGDPNIVASFTADLSGLGGQAATIVASGLLGDTPNFTLLAVLPDGTVVELPATEFADLQVIHNSPTAGTTAGPVVDIYVNGVLLDALTGVPYRAATPFLELPANVGINVAVAVNPSTSVDDAIVDFNLGQLAADENYTVVATGIVGNMETPFNLAVNAGAQQAAAMPGMVDFNVYHGSTDAPNVDVDARLVGNLISDLAYGDFSDGYISVAPDTYFIDVRAAGDPNIVATFEADLSALAGGAATVFASGLLADTPAFGLFAALADGSVVELPTTQIARLQVIHNSATPSTGTGPAVDIYVNGDLFLPNVAYRQATGYLTVPAGVELNIGVAAAGSGSVADTIANFPVTLVNGDTYIATANGVVGDMATPFTLDVFDQAREASNDPANADFAVLHGSPGAPNVDVDLRVFGNLITDLAYGEYVGYVSAAPQQYFIDIRATGNPDIVATFSANLEDLAGQAFTVVASGFLGGDPGFGLLAVLADGTVLELPATEVARVQVIHNSPSPTVDVYANGGILLDDFEYQTATPFITLPAGVDIDLAIAPGDSQDAGDAIFETTVSFVNGETYAVIANGIVGNAETPFGLAVSAMAQERSTVDTEAQLMVFHGTPDAPNVDVAQFAQAALISDLAFGSFTDGYLGFEPDGYSLEIRPAGGGFNDVVATFSADVSEFAGGAGIVVASGTLADDDTEFDLLLITPDGAVNALTPIALLNVIHNSPAEVASTVDVWAQGAVKIIEDLDFQTATGIGYFPTRLPLTIGIAPGDSQTPADILFNVSDPVVLRDGAYNVLIANGIPGDMDTPFELVFNADLEVFSEEPSNIDATVFHGSQNAPAVDVRARDLNLDLISGLNYSDFSETLPIPASTYYLEVYPEGSSDLVATFETELPGDLAGLSAVGVASGLVGEEPPFDLIFFPPVNPSLRATPVAQVQVVHNSPAPTVDVYANDGLLLDNFAFRTATPFVDLPTRTDFTLDVAGEDSNSSADAIASFEGVRFNDGQKYIVMATGLVGDMDTPFGLDVFDMGQTSAAADGVDILFYHGATDAPTVDVVVADNQAVLFDDASYGDFQGYANVPAASYQLNVTPGNDNNTVVKAYEADLTGLEGGAATVFASGLLGETEGESAFAVWVALADGMTFPLPELVNTDEVADKFAAFQVAPNPVRDLAQVQYTTTETLNMVEEIRDLNGRLIRSSAIGTQPAGDHSREINASELAAGVYTYNLVTELGTMSKRFVVAK
jgi:hypothetical protein